jgi:uncharacterized membrane protein
MTILLWVLAIIQILIAVVMLVSAINREASYWFAALLFATMFGLSAWQHIDKAKAPNVTDYCIAEEDMEVGQAYMGMNDVYATFVQDGDRTLVIKICD